MVDKVNRRFGLMSVAILMALVSLLTGVKGSPYTFFWIYAAHLSYKGDIKTLKLFLIITISINAVIAAGLLLLLDPNGVQQIFPDVKSYFVLLVFILIPLAIKIAMLMRVNSLIGAEDQNSLKKTTPIMSQPLSANNQKSAHIEIVKKVEKIDSPEKQKTTTMMSSSTKPATDFALSDSRVNERRDGQPSIADWELALDEYNGGKRNNGLWAKIFAENNGDENSTKAQYLKIRAVEISRQRIKFEPTHQAAAYENASNSICIEGDALSYHQSNFKFPVFRLANGNYAIYHNWKYKIYSTLDHLKNAIEVYELTESFPKEGFIEEYAKK